MAFAAGIPDERAEFFDTTGRLVVHPMFPVAPEWELLTTHRSVGEVMSPQEIVRGVHASHDLVLAQPIPVGERITVRAVVVAVDRRPSGASQQTMFEATGADGRTIWRTLLTSVFRGVELAGDPTSIDVGWPAGPARPIADDEPVATRTSRVRAVDAHVYTECARIWNPIHTDVAIARSAGLSAPILHGTATLARAVSACIEFSGRRPDDVARIGASFAATVALDSTIEIRLYGADADIIHFDVLNEQGEPAIRHGYVAVRTIP
jgi:acyl dehydratase